MPAFTKTQSSMATLMMASFVAASATGCGPITPVSPTWKGDIRPLLVSRCLRCHDGSGKGDAKVTNGALGSVAYNFDYADLPSPLPPSLTALKMTGPRVCKGELPGRRRMPPPPNEALETWQIDMLQAWADYPQ